MNSPVLISVVLLDFFHVHRTMLISVNLSISGIDLDYDKTYQFEQRYFICIDINLSNYSKFDHVVLMCE